MRPGRATPRSARIVHLVAAPALGTLLLMPWAAQSTASADAGPALPGLSTSEAPSPQARPATVPEPLTFRAADGVTIHGELYRAEAPDDAPVVLLFHQGAGSSAEYTPIAPRLSGAGYHAIAIDQRRGGDMFGRPNRTLEGLEGGPPESYCDVYPDLEATLYEARAQGLSGPVVAWGSSYSAALVMRLALEHPDEIVAVVAFSPASTEPMAGCEPEPWARRLRQPLFVGRPSRELEIDWIHEQYELFRSLGATIFIAPEARHASSMLAPERNETSTEPAWAALSAFLYAHVPPPGRRVTIGNDGWELAGDLTLPLTAGPHPAALLLHRAAGSRAEHEELAVALARRGIASLRLDLRGHGDSTNLGRFDPDDPSTMHLIDESSDDVRAALEALPRLASIDMSRIAAVGASYTGESVAQAARQSGRYVAAYVELSPGSFSDESIAAIDTSGADWLFIRSEIELPFFDELFAAIDAGGDAEIRVIPGRHHATRMLQVPGMVEQVADWIAARIGPEAS